MSSRTKRVVFRTRVSASPDEVWQLHSSVENIVRISPKFPKVKVVGEDARVENGALHVLEIGLFFFKVVWKARISDVVPGRGFTDTAEQSPFEFWQHRHLFEPDGEGTVIVDEVEYRFRSGLIGSLFGWFVDSQVKAMFKGRAKAYVRELGEPKAD